MPAPSSPFAVGTQTCWPGGLRVLESHPGGRLLRVAHAPITVLGAVILATTAGCRQQPPDTQGASEERNKALVRRWIEEGFNRRSLTVVDDVFAEQLTVNGQVIGRDGLRIEGGKITDARLLSDLHGLLTQLGATVTLPGSPERAPP